MSALKKLLETEKAKAVYDELIGGIDQEVHDIKGRFGNQGGLVPSWVERFTAHIQLANMKLENRRLAILTAMHVDKEEMNALFSRMGGSQSH